MVNDSLDVKIELGSLGRDREREGDRQTDRQTERETLWGRAYWGCGNVGGIAEAETAKRREPGSDS